MTIGAILSALGNSHFTMYLEHVKPGFDRE